MLVQLIKSSQFIIDRLPGQIASVNVGDLLSWQGVVIEENVDLGRVKADLLALFKDAMADLKEGRRREGKMIAETIQDRLNQLSTEVTKIKEIIPSIVDRQREKILQRIEELKVTLDVQRLEQEMVYYAQRYDVSEEIDRTLAHISEVTRALTEVKSAGRRLDFMMQELNREANTLASKSVDPNLTHAAVEMKVLIEQMREQVQNIE